jgi:glycosyltransferase involved in cell wall biosynthesis
MPCYNHGEYLVEALDSIKKQSYPNYEIIIVDDGTTDTSTLELLNKTSEYATVIHQNNAGPSVARDTGIRKSSGRYLFFLDSDNRVGSQYISKGVEVMEANPKVGVVYSDALIFGAVNERKVSGEFDMDSMVFANPIDICSVMRRQTYDDAGGFDAYLSKLGLEDWEFWFSVYSSGWQFHYLPEILFEYRAADASRTVQVANKNLGKIISHIFQKHSGLVMERYKFLYYENKELKTSIDNRIGRVILKPYRFLKSLIK